MRQKTRNIIKKDVHRSEKAVLRREKLRLKRAERAKDLRAFNAQTGDYTATLLDPSGTTGVKIPDADCRPSFTAHARAVYNLAPQCKQVADQTGTTDNGIGLCAFISPMLDDSVVTPHWVRPNPLSPAQPTFADWGALRQAIYGQATAQAPGDYDANTANSVHAAWINGNVLPSYTNTAVGIRVVSASARVDYIGPALTAQGNYVVGFVDALQNVENGTVIQNNGGTITTVAYNTQDFFSSFTGATQLPDAYAYSSMTAAEVTWRPLDVANQRYCELDALNTKDQLAPMGYQWGSDASVTWTVPGANASLGMNHFGLAQGLVPVGSFFIFAQGLDPNLWTADWTPTVLATSAGVAPTTTPCFQVTIDVNYELIPRNNQMMLGQSLGIRHADTTALDMAANHVALAPSVIQASDHNGDELPDDHPANVIRNAQKEAVDAIGGARGTPKESQITSGATFFQKAEEAMSKIAPLAEKVLPEFASLL